MRLWISGALVIVALAGCATLHEIHGDGILPPPPAGSSSRAKDFFMPQEASAAEVAFLDDSAAHDTSVVERETATSKSPRHFFYDPTRRPEVDTIAQKTAEANSANVNENNERAYQDTAYHASAQAVDTVLIRLSWGAIRRHLETAQHLPVRSIVWPTDVVVAPRAGKREITIVSEWVPLRRFSPFELDCSGTAPGAAAARVVMSVITSDTLRNMSTVTARSEFRGVSQCRVGEDWINRVSGVAFDTWMDIDRVVGALVHPTF